MFGIFFKYEKHRKYIRSDDCMVWGHAYYQGKLYQNFELLQLVLSWSTKKQFLIGIKNLNGSFMIVKKNHNQILAAVDRLRSVPLFYGHKRQDFFISDSADWINEQIQDHGFNFLSYQELLTTGYVTGSDTLYKNVNQIKAGEIIIAADEYNELKLDKIKYYQFIHSYNNEANNYELLKEYNKVLIHVFSRLIETLNGRNIVIPLSGGYDSRLILLMLKRLNYDNLIAFSYGVPGNNEAEIARRIAQKLKIRWEFIPYNNSKWNRWFNSDERRDYWNFAGGQCSVVHDQDWPAVWELKKKEFIEPNSIFVPGHSADLLAGNRSRYYANRALYNNSNKVKEKLLLEKIFKFHYCLRDSKSIDKTLKQKFEEKILLTLGNLRQFTDNANAFEYWDMVERQAKFIINSLRVYEFWGYEWRIPFWDLEYINFWRHVPIKYRINENLHTSVIDNLYLELTGEKITQSLGQKENAGRRILKTSIPFYLQVFLKVNLNKVKNIKEVIKNGKKNNIIEEYHYHPLAWYGRYSFSEYINRVKEGKLQYANIYALLAHTYVEEQMERLKINKLDNVKKHY